MCMKELCVYLYNTVAVLLKFIVSALSVLLFSSFRANNAMAEIRRKITRHECVVFGNGPSLGKLINHYSDLIHDSDVIALNYFCNTHFFRVVKPQYYILLDPQLFAKPYIPDVQMLIENISSIDWDMILFLPTKNRRSGIENEIKNNRVRICYYNSTPVEVCASIDKFFFKFNLGMPWPETVIVAAIFQMINLHYDVIHLFGVEQSWLKMIRVDDNNHLTIGLEHFYGVTDEDKSKKYLHVFLESQARAFKSNVRLSEYAESIGVKVINHTPNSYLDAYKKQIPEL